jgi:hypothetical protein
MSKYIDGWEEPVKEVKNAKVTGEDYISGWGEESEASVPVAPITPPPIQTRPQSILTRRFGDPYEGARSEMDFLLGRQEITRMREAAKIEEPEALPKVYAGPLPLEGRRLDTSNDIIVPMKERLTPAEVIEGAQKETVHIFNALGNAMGEWAKTIRNIPTMLGGSPTNLPLIAESFEALKPIIKEKAQKMLDNMPADPEFVQLFGPDGRGILQIFRDPLTVPYFFAKSIPYMAALTTGAVISLGNPAGPILVGMNIYGGQAVEDYETEMMLKGGEVDPRIASALFFTVGPINAALDFAGISNLINNTPGARGLLNKVVYQGLREGVTEALQATTEELSKKIGYNDPIELWKIIESGLVGFMVGAPLGPLAPTEREPGEVKHERIVGNIANTVTVADEVMGTRSVPEATREIQEKAKQNMADASFDTERIKVEEKEGEEQVIQDILKLAQVDSTELDMAREVRPEEGEQTGRSMFRQEKTTTDARAMEYVNNPKIYQSNPEAYAAWLLNGVNQYLDGSIDEDLVETYRERLNDLATQVDSSTIKSHFIGKNGLQNFEEFKALVRDMSVWAELATRENEPVIIGDPVEVIQSEWEAVKEFGKKSLLPKEAFTALKANREVIEKAYERSTGKEMDRVESSRQAVEKLAKEDKGFMLYSGIPLQQAYEGFSNMWKTFKAGKFQKNEWDKGFRPARRMVWDHFGDMREELEKFGLAGQRVINEFLLSAGASAKAENEIAHADRVINRGLNKENKELLETVIFARRLQQIQKTHPKFKGYKDKKTGLNIGGNEATFYLEQVKNNIGDDAFKNLNKRANIYFGYHKRYIRRLHKESMISDETYDNLRHLDYQRRQLIEIIDPEGIFRPGGVLAAKKTGVEWLRTKGIEEDVLETDAMFLLQQFAVTTETSIAKNNAAKALVLLAEQVGATGLIKKRPKGKSGKLESIPGWTPFSVWIDRKKSHYMMPEVIARQWNRSYGQMPYIVSKWARILSGSNILKPMATGINLKFAFSQIPMDFMHMWWSSQIPVGEVEKVRADGSKYKELQWKSTYNPFTAPWYFGTDFKKFYGDAWHKRGKFEDAAKDGMLMHFLAQSTRSSVDYATGKRDKIVPILELFSHIATTNEIAGRLALREQAGRQIAKREGISLEEVWKKSELSREASAVARDYLDYAQGGSIAKNVDVFTPYLNASIQATRGIFRPMQRNKWEQALKVGMLALPVGLSYAAMRAFGPETWKNMSDRQKQDYLNIPLADLYIEDPDTGKKRYLFLQLKLDKGQRVFTNMWRYAFTRMFGTPGEKEDAKFNAANVIGNITDSLSPADISSLPPTINAWLAYGGNYDTWTQDQIWKGGDVEGRYKYDPLETPQYAQDIGTVLNKSPEQIDRAMEKIFTSGNEVTGFLGYCYEILRNVDPALRMDIAAELAYRFPFIAITGTTQEDKKLSEEVARDARTQRLIANHMLKVLVTEFKHPDSKTTYADVLKFALEADTPQEQQRRVDAAEKMVEMYGISNYEFWAGKMLMQPTPEARAQLFYRKYQREDEGGRAALMEQLNDPRVSKIATERFQVELERLFGEGG